MTALQQNSDRWLCTVQLELGDAELARSNWERLHDEGHPWLLDALSQLHRPRLSLTRYCRDQGGSKRSNLWNRC